MTTIEQISRTLRERRLRVCLAESFTGGGLCSRFVSVPGASDILKVGLVCYSEESKRKFLGVKEETLRTYGAVSAETVSEMLDGLHSLQMGEVLVATSGNAGPSAEKDDEVGVFFVGVMYNGKKIIRRFATSGSRSEVIEQGIGSGLRLIENIIG